MLKDEKNIDRLFRDGLEDFEPPVPSFVWNEVETKIDRSNRIRLWTYIGGVAASVALFLSFVAGYYLSTQEVDKFALQEKFIDSILTHKTNPVTEINQDSDVEKIVPKLNEQDKKKKDVELAVLANSLNTEYKIKKTTSSSTQTEKTTEKNLRNTAENVETPNNNFQIHDWSQNKQKSEVVFSSPHKKSAWVVGGQFSPVYTLNRSSLAMRETVGEPINAMNIGNEKLYNSIETPLLAFCGGVRIEYRSDNRWSIQTGFFYTRLGQVSSDVYTGAKNATTIIDANSQQQFAPPNVQTNAFGGQFASQSAPASSLAFTSSEIIQNFEYIEIPLIFRYRLMDRRLGFNVLGGVSTNLLVGNDVYVHEAGKKMWVGETADIRIIKYNGILGFGLDYQISKRISFSLEPTFKYSLDAISHKSSTTYFPYSFALFTGINYSF